MADASQLDRIEIGIQHVHDALGELGQRVAVLEVRVDGHDAALATARQGAAGQAADLVSLREYKARLSGAQIAIGTLLAALGTGLGLLLSWADRGTP